MHNLTVKKQAQGLEIALKSAKTSCLIKDTLYQIIRATHPSIPNPLEQFSYDETGNRLTDNTHTNYQYNELNQLTEDDSCRYVYDADGNQTEKIGKATGDTMHFVYDIENKLVEVRKPGMLAKYTYDALGRRMSKEVNGEVKQFRYDGEDLILEMDANNSVTANYTFGPGIDNPLMMQRNGKGYYYVKDGLGSVTALTDSTGNVKHEYKYGVFGKIAEESGDTIENQFTYTSRELDKEAGNYYYRARFYDPRTGRFLNEDPLGFLSEDDNFYRYVFNNSVNTTDPLGLWCIPLPSEKKFLGHHKIGTEEITITEHYGIMGPKGTYKGAIPDYGQGDIMTIRKVRVYDKYLARYQITEKKFCCENESSGTCGDTKSKLTCGVRSCDSRIEEKEELKYKYTKDISLWK
jgi:RHS repeat-associated protein